MFDESVVQKLTQANISKDGTATMERVKAIWKAAPEDSKKKVEALAGVTRNTVARVYKTGSLSAKLAVALALVLNVDPFYLICESDEQGEYSEELLVQFLVSKGYEELAKTAVKPARKRRAKAAKTKEDKVETAADVIEEASAPVPDTAIPAAEPEVAAPVASVCVCGEQTADMPEDEMIQLIRALYLRAKYSETAAMTLANIRKLVVS